MPLTGGSHNKATVHPGGARAEDIHGVEPLPARGGKEDGMPGRASSTTTMLLF